MKDLAIIVVGYDLKRTIYALGAYGVLADLIGIKERVLVWNGDQKYPANFALYAPSWKLHHGSNVNFEFSGWQEGVRILSKPLLSYRYVLFANDTIARADSDARKSMLLPMMKEAITGKRSYDAIGLIHHSPKLGLSAALGQYYFENWMCTACFALSGSVLERLRGVVDYSSLCSEYISDSDNDIILNAKANKVLREYIDWWLADPVNGWYKAIPRPRTATDIGLLRKKSLMILDEFMLSIQIKNAEGRFLDPRALSPGSNRKLSLIRIFARFIKRLGRLAPVG